MGTGIDAKKGIYMSSESLATLSLFDELPPVQEAGYRATVVRSHTRRLPGDPQTPTETASKVARSSPKRRAETINGMPRQDSYHSDYVDTPALAPVPSKPAPVPHNGTDTSRAGAAMVEASGRAATQKERIRVLVLAHNSSGLTRQEIAAISGIPLASVCGRVSQLVKESVCVETGLTKTGPDGCEQKLVQVGEFRPPIAHSGCAACREAFSLESRLYYIEGHGYLTVRVCSSCGHKEVA